MLLLLLLLLLLLFLLYYYDNSRARRESVRADHSLVCRPAAAIPNPALRPLPSHVPTFGHHTRRALVSPGSPARRRQPGILPPLSRPSFLAYSLSSFLPPAAQAGPDIRPHAPRRPPHPRKRCKPSAQSGASACTASRARAFTVPRHPPPPRPATPVRVTGPRRACSPAGQPLGPCGGPPPAPHRPCAMLRPRRRPAPIRGPGPWMLDGCHAAHVRLRGCMAGPRPETRHGPGRTGPQKENGGPSPGNSIGGPGGRCART